MVGSVCVLVRKPPYGTEDAFAGFKLALATIANGMKTKVILMEDGVFNAIKNQKPEKIGMPSILDAMNDLLSLDVKICCVEDYLPSRHIRKEDLIENLIYIEEKELSEIILDCDVITAF